MGQKSNDQLVAMCGQLQPPPLDARLLRLWHREFDRFPVGHFTPSHVSTGASRSRRSSGHFRPSDVSGMRLYLEVLAEYEAARRRANHARSMAAKRVEREEMRAICRQLITLQRALRMFPSTRTHPTTMGRLAHDTTKQAMAQTDEPAWRRIMREAGNLKPN